MYIYTLLRRNKSIHSQALKYLVVQWEQISTVVRICTLITVWVLYWNIISPLNICRIFLYNRQTKFLANGISSTAIIARWRIYSFASL